MIRPSRVTVFVAFLLALRTSVVAEVIHPDEAPAVWPEVSLIAFGSCLVPERGHPILDAVIADSPDLFIFTGDNVYADTTRPEVMARHYQALADSASFVDLTAAVPVIAIWDDHDYGANDAGAAYPMRAESERQFERFWSIPKRLSPSAAPGAGDRPGVYQSYLFGPPERRLQIILLDTRYFRSELTTDRASGASGPYRRSSDSDDTLLGADQWEWLSRELDRDARLRIIVSGIQVLAADHGWESWSNFPHERDRLFALIGSKDATGVIFVTGDRHFAEFSRLDDAARYPLYDVTSSGLNQRFPAPAPNDNPERVGGYYLDVNYGRIDIDWSFDDPRITIGVLNVAGGTVLSLELALSELE